MQMILNNEDTLELVFKIHDIDEKVPIILIDKTDKDNRILAEHLKVAAFIKKPTCSFDVYQVIKNSLEEQVNNLSSNA